MHHASESVASTEGLNAAQLASVRSISMELGLTPES